MKGQTDLLTILRTLKPVWNAGTYVYLTVEPAKQIDMTRILAFFREQEGVTLIVEKSYADEQHLCYSFVCAWITLSVHTSLESVGLTACFATALSKANISCNVVAAFYHDHVFVPINEAASALQVLQSLRNAQD